MFASPSAAAATLSSPTPGRSTSEPGLSLQQSGLLGLFTARPEVPTANNGFARVLDQRLFEHGNNGHRATPERPQQTGAATSAERNRTNGVQTGARSEPEPARAEHSPAAPPATDKSAERSGDENVRAQRTASDGSTGGEHSTQDSETPAEAAAAAQANAAAPPAEQAAAVAGLPAALAASPGASGEDAAEAALDAEGLEAGLQQSKSDAQPGAGRAQGKHDLQPADGPALASAALKSNGHAAPSHHAQAQFSVPGNGVAPGVAPAAGNGLGSGADSNLPTNQSVQPSSSPFGPPTALRHAPATQAVPQLPITSPAGRQPWAEELGSQVRWMLGRAESRAELVLTPPSLGRLEVSISLSGDQTTAQFVASTQAARDALEQAMPKLREILEQAGLALGHTDVSTPQDESAAGQQQQSGGTQADHREGRADGSAASPLANREIIRQHDGLIDTFA